MSEQWKDDEVFSKEIFNFQQLKKKVDPSINSSSGLESLSLLLCINYTKLFGTGKRNPNVGEKQPLTKSGKEKESKEIFQIKDTLTQRHRFLSSLDTW